MKRVDYWAIFVAGMLVGSGVIATSSSECDLATALLPNFTITADENGIHVGTK